MHPLYPVYTIQPVVKPVVQLVWQPAVSCKQTSNRLWDRFDNHVERTATVRSTGYQTGLYNRFDNRLYTRYNWLSTVWQQVASCRRGFSISQLTNLRLSLGRARDMYWTKRHFNQFTNSYLSPCRNMTSSKTYLEFSCDRRLSLSLLTFFDTLTGQYLTGPTAIVHL